MNTRQVGIPEMTAEQRRVTRTAEALHRDGASPAGTLELLASIVLDGTWERLVDVHGRPFAGRFREFVKAKPPHGLDFAPDQLPKVLELRHPREANPEVAHQMARMREAVRELLVAKHGGDRSKSKNDNMTLAPVRTGTSKDYALRKLRKDAPKLYAEVQAGNLTAHSAMVKAGFRPPTFTVRADNPRSVAAALRRRLDREQLAELARLLTDDPAVPGVTR